MESNGPLKAPGTLFGSLKPRVPVDYRRRTGVFLGDPKIRAIFEKPEYGWYVHVEGFNNSLPLDEIKEALNNHFKSCGVIARVFLNTNPETNVVDSHASIAIIGDDVDERVKELDGSELAGRKLIVKPAQRAPNVIMRNVPFA
ncbi:PREDICTED: nucleolin 2-like [Camelina sativa]|uniref:Nucleolin 2-like n=1 Tax=Camelina sativa TaxID=90675 RepID=A0ABM0UVC7_CAMSA|nr:PREDICTED: nucleolin 2-like [Camelina sativa]